jgi:carbamoyltransferase
MIVVGALVETGANGVDPVDGGIAIWRDGKFVFGLPEERVTRRKHCGGFRMALSRGLDLLGLGMADVDAFAFVSYGEPTPASIDHILNRAPELIGYRHKVHLCRSHHFAHALTAARFSPWDDALIVVIDNEGTIIGPQRDNTVTKNPMERVSFYISGKNSVDLLTRDLYGSDDVSLGEAYRRFSYYAGFPSHQLAGKTMALAALGDPMAFGEISLFTSSGGPLGVNLTGSYSEPAASVLDFFARNGVTVAPARACDGSIEADHRNAAALVQYQLEKALTARVKYLLAATHQEAVCLAGGVAYNCKLIATLEHDLGIPVFVPPSPGDQGLGLGAVLDVLESKYFVRKRYEPTSRLGGRYRPSAASLTDVEQRLNCTCSRPPDAKLASAVVDRLIDGAIVGLFEGASEIGRRALGGRSLLCLPDPVVMDRLRLLKRRESFRPFGASVLQSEARLMFPFGQPDPFMLRAPMVVSHSPLRHVAHSDGTLRAQLVMSSESTLLRAILEELQARGRVGAVVNTSMNRAGEALVEDDGNALALFEAWGDLDLLVFSDDGVLLERTQKAVL